MKQRTSPALASPVMPPPILSDRTPISTGPHAAPKIKENNCCAPAEVALNRRGVTSALTAQKSGIAMGVRNPSITASNVDNLSEVPMVIKKLPFTKATRKYTRAKKYIRPLQYSHTYNGTMMPMFVQG